MVEELVPTQAWEIILAGLYRDRCRVEVLAEWPDHETGLCVPIVLFEASCGEWAVYYPNAVLGSGFGRPEVRAEAERELSTRGLRLRESGLLGPTGVYREIERREDLE